MSITSPPSLQPTRDVLVAQFNIAWALASYHLKTLTTEECLWQPASKGLHINKDESGRWQAEWPEQESYDIGPPSIAWTTWHICFWWTKTLEHIQGRATLSRKDVEWPGTADEVRDQITELRNRWSEFLTNCTDNDLQTLCPTSWPIPESTLGTIAAWLNVELMKNAAEIGVIRFLYATQPAHHSKV